MFNFHPKLTRAVIEEAVRRQMTSLDSPGFCNACGAEAEGCEPDAQNYECESCGENEVYGAEHLFLCLPVQQN